MKASPKFDPAAIKQFFLENVEKIVFGACVCVLLYFLVGSLWVGGYNKRPPDLIITTGTATTRIQEGPKPMEKLPEPDFLKPIVEVGAIDLSHYATPMPWFKPPRPQRQLREAPQMLAVQNLHAEVGRGPVSFQQTGREVTRGQRWVLLVAAVPVKDQIERFRNALEGATYADATKDTPQYLGFFVERTELGGSPAKPGKREVLFTTRTMDEVTGKWARFDTDVVDDKYLQPTLTSRLPTTDRAWGAEAACNPQVPVRASDTPADDAAAKPAGAAPDDASGAPPANPFQVAPAVAKPAPARTGAPVVVVRKPDPGDQAQTPYYLFRYFDTKVEPGRHYRYRVILVLNNPNFGVQPVFLRNPSSGATPYLGLEIGEKDGEMVVRAKEPIGKWSAPTEPIYVPEDTQVLAGEVNPRGAEVNGKLRVVHWVEKTGVKAWDEFPRVRGSVADFPECRFRTRGKDGQSVTVNYLTGHLVVDMNAGPPPTGHERGPLRPGEILTMDRTGKLFLHDEAVDEAVYQAAAKAPTGLPPPPKPGTNPAVAPPGAKPESFLVPDDGSMQFGRGTKGTKGNKK